MQTGKTFHFSADGGAALAYRTRLGIAVVGGDPIGDQAFDSCIFLPTASP